MGFQAHLGLIPIGQYPDAATIEASLQRFADLGLEVELTELDVTLVFRADDVPSRLAFQGGRGRLEPLRRSKSPFRHAAPTLPATMRAARSAILDGGERVTPQAGGFYGAWITSDIMGPFKVGLPREWSGS